MSISYQSLLSAAHDDHFAVLHGIMTERHAQVQRRAQFSKRLKKTLELAPDQQKLLAATTIQRKWRKTSGRALTLARAAEAFGGKAFGNRPSTPDDTVRVSSRRHANSLLGGMSHGGASDLMWKCKVDNLEKLVFSDQLEEFDTHELMTVFNQFGLLSAQHLQIRLYEKASDAAFKAIPQVRESYAMAHIRTSQSARACSILKQLIADGCSSGQRRNFLGDSLCQMVGAARDLRHALEGVGSTTKEDAYEAYCLHFGTKPEPEGWSACNVYNDELVHSNQALQAYAEAFCESFDPNALLRSVVLVYDRCSRTFEKDPVWSGPQGRAKTLKLARQLVTLADLGLTRDGGEESTDYWVHSGHLEVCCMMHRGPRHLLAAVNAVINRCRAPHQLRVTLNRLVQLVESEKNVGLEGTAQTESAISVIKDAIKYFAATGKRLEKHALTAIAQDAPPPSPAPGSGQAPFKSTPAIQGFLKGTFQMRGLIAAVRPSVVPGGIGAVGARYPDLIVTSVDLPVFMQLLDAWGLAKEEDPERFLATISMHVRQCFETHLLQDLHSPSHARFDAASDALIDLCGIGSDRKGHASSTNASAALTFVGDCREHAQEMLALHSTWQLQRINRLLATAWDASECGGASNSLAFEEAAYVKAPQILRQQLRGAHCQVFAPVQMDAKYKPTGCDNGGVPTMKVYKHGEALSKYELENSLLFVTFKDGEHIAIEPKWIADKKIYVMPNANGVPLIPTAKDHKGVEHVSLFQLVEEHTMTFRVDIGKDGVFQVARCDAFYNESFDNRPKSEGGGTKSPYQFGSGVCNIEQTWKCAKTLEGGTTLVKPGDGTDELKRVPVLLRLLPFSGRSDVPAMSETSIALQFLGMPLEIDVMKELEAEDEARRQGKPTKKSEFLDRLAAWSKRRKAAQGVAKKAVNAVIAAKKVSS